MIGIIIALVLIVIVIAVLGTIVLWFVIQQRLPPPSDRTAMSDAVQEFDHLSHTVKRSVELMQRDFDLMAPRRRR